MKILATMLGLAVLFAAKDQGYITDLQFLGFAIVGGAAGLKDEIQQGWAFIKALFTK